ncbi:MAG TPA: head maturation protease, ClpP-related [Acidobacteriaceae bacterium]|jgi:ATP-dependent protease ClpP protease subunit
MRVLATLNARHTAVPGIRAVVSDNQLSLDIYGNIGASFWDDGVSVADIAAQLSAARGVSGVTVRINSPGGNCFDGVAIYNLLKSFPAPVTTIVDGLAASAASLIAMAGDTVRMGRGTMLMIHPAMIMAYGDSAEMRSAADILDKVTGQMAEIYAAKTKKSTDDLTAMMYAETWMSADDAVEGGFADEVAQEDGDPLGIAANYDLSVFAKVPESLKIFQAEANTKVPSGKFAAQVRLRTLELM